MLVKQNCLFEVIYITCYKHLNFNISYTLRFHDCA